MVVKLSITGHGFEVGDMVWAKMKSQPWWPGHVYNEELATPLVRRSKREGLLLVALFGASSYAWFDPSELIQFDSNYAEKSLQTDSKKFVRAVEDAIREVNRRIDLGLCCMCGNNKQNFREIDVQGFVSVDVAGYEPGAVYSIDVIEKARVSFQPKLTHDFLRGLALEPTVSEHGDISFIKNKATVMSYRKAVFEEFNLAFGYEPVCASIQEPARRELSSKAPLSGREVKNTAKLKDHTKKDDSMEIKEEKEVTSSSLPVPFKDLIIAAGEFSNAHVDMSTRIVESSKKTGQPEGDGDHESEVSRVLGDLLSLAVDPFNVVNRRSRIYGRKACLRFRALVFHKGRNFSLQLTGDEPSASKSSEDSVEVPPVKPLDKLKRGPSVRLEEKAAAKRKKVCDIRNLTKEKKVTKKIDEPPVPVRDLKHQAAAMVMKKLASGEPNAGKLSEDPIEVPPVKPQGGLKHGTSDHLDLRHQAAAMEMKKLACDEPNAGKLSEDRVEVPPVKPQGRLKHGTSDHLDLKHQAAAMEMKKLASDEPNSGKLSEDRVEVPPVKPQGGLKHRPFDHHDFNHQAAAVAMKKFSGGEPNAGKLATDRVEVPLVKPQGGLKRGPFDHQDEIEMAVARQKKVCDIKNLTKEKKVTKKIDEPPARDVKQSVAVTFMKPRPELIKKTVQPTMLMIKVPKGGSLPSFKELKARFACYGPMDHSGTHIFWSTFSCQVVFKYRAHAQAAYRSVVESNSLFGNTGVKCTLKALGSAEPEPPVKVPKEDHNQSDMEHKPLTMVPTTSCVELKSILKKSGGDEVADSGVRGHVKFNMENKTCHLTTDFSKNLQKVVDNPSVVTCTRSPSQPRHYRRPSNAPPPLMTPNMDVAQQMLSLLTRCNDVVTNVSSMLGYSPYHPL